MNKPYINQISIVPSKGKFGVVLDVVYKDMTRYVVDAIEDNPELALNHANYLCQIWGLELHVDIPNDVITQ